MIRFARSIIIYVILICKGFDVLEVYKQVKLDLGSKIDTSNLQQPLVASFQPPPWPQKHIHENRGIEDLAT